MGQNTCQVKYLMLRCYPLLEIQLLSLKPQLIDKPGIYFTDKQAGNSSSLCHGISPEWAKYLWTLMRGLRY